MFVEFEVLAVGFGVLDVGAGGEVDFLVLRGSGGFGIHGVAWKKTNGAKEQKEAEVWKLILTTVVSLNLYRGADNPGHRAAVSS